MSAGSGTAAEAEGAARLLAALEHLAGMSAEREAALEASLSRRRDALRALLGSGLVDPGWTREGQALMLIDMDDAPEAGDGRDGGDLRGCWVALRDAEGFADRAATLAGDVAVDWRPFDDVAAAARDGRLALVVVAPAGSAAPMTLPDGRVRLTGPLAEAAAGDAEGRDALETVRWCLSRARAEALHARGGPPAVPDAADRAALDAHLADLRRDPAAAPGAAVTSAASAKSFAEAAVMATGLGGPPGAWRTLLPALRSHPALAGTPADGPPAGTAVAID